MIRERSKQEKRIDELRAIEEAYGSAVAYLIERARYDYLAFYTLFGLRPEARKTLGAMHQYLCGLVQDVFDGVEGKRQTSSAPPQHGKSDVLVRMAIPWLMGARPGIQIGLAAYDYALVEELSMSGQSVVEHPWYRLVFPDTVSGVDWDREPRASSLDPKMKRIVNWGTRQGSRVRAVSFGKKLVGRRVDWFLGDDIYPGREEVERTVIREKVKRWFFADCMTRLSPGATVWLVGTRWHPQDLQGYLHSDEYRERLIAAGVEEELYNQTNLPAIADPAVAEPDPLGRRAGEPLAPELGRTEKFLRGARDGGMPSYEWDSQYQGNPRTAGSGQVDVTLFSYVDDINDIPSDAVWTRGWDLAAKAQQRHDYSVGAKCAWHEETQTLYIADIWRKRLPWPKLKQRIAGLAKVEATSDKRPILKIGVEAVAGFEHSYQDLRELLLGKVRVERRNPRGKDKLVRALPWFNKVEAGNVVLVRGKWNKEFLSELEVFPDGDHDDQIDGVTIAHEVLCRKLKIRRA